METTLIGDRKVPRLVAATARRLGSLLTADGSSRPILKVRIATSHSTCTGSEPAVTWDAVRQERPVLPPPRSLPAREPKDRLTCGISPPPLLSSGYRCALPARQPPPTACQFVAAHQQRFESSAAAVDERLDRRFVRDPLPLELLLARGGLATVCSLGDIRIALGIDLLARPDAHVQNCDRNRQRPNSCHHANQFLHMSSLYRNSPPGSGPSLPLRGRWLPLPASGEAGLTRGLRGCDEVPGRRSSRDPSSRRSVSTVVADGQYQRAQNGNTAN